MPPLDALVGACRAEVAFARAVDLDAVQIVPPARTQREAIARALMLARELRAEIVVATMSAGLDGLRARLSEHRGTPAE